MSLQWEFPILKRINKKKHRFFILSPNEIKSAGLSGKDNNIITGSLGLYSTQIERYDVSYSSRQGLHAYELPVEASTGTT